MRRLVLAAALALLAPQPLAAQAAVSPLLTEPGTLGPGGYSIGGYISIEDAIDLFAVYRRGLTPRLDLGIRAGYSDAFGDALHLGGDLRYELQRAGPDFPLDLSLVGGVQAGLGDRASLIAFPIGVSFGRDVGSTEVPAVIYALPHLRVERIDPDAGRGDTQLELSVELGAQVEIARSLFLDGALTLASDNDDNIALALGLRSSR